MASRELIDWLRKLKEDWGLRQHEQGSPASCNGKSTGLERERIGP